MKIFAATFLLALFVQSSFGQKDIVDMLADLSITTLKTYLDTAGLTDTLKNGNDLTLFAPTDAAFDALDQSVKDELAANVTLLSNVLTYHVAGVKAMSSGLANEQLVASLYTGYSIRINIYSGGSVITASGSQVTNPDQEGTNGVIHVVDKVMMPPTGGNVVEFATANNFNNLTSLVVLANLATTLSGGNLTVFAPSNAAFGKVDQATLDELKNDISKLTKVLTYHVIDGVYFSKGLGSSQDVPTLNSGETVRITKSGSGEVKVNDFTVVSADNLVTNGVIHALDNVLIPDGVIGAAWGLRPSLLVALVSGLLVLLFKH